MAAVDGYGREVHVEVQSRVVVDRDGREAHVEARTRVVVEVDARSLWASPCNP